MGIVRPALNWKVSTDGDARECLQLLILSSGPEASFVMVAGSAMADAHILLTPDSMRNRGHVVLWLRWPGLAWPGLSYPVLSSTINRLGANRMTTQQMLFRHEAARSGFAN
jgi:hypothetical protein